MTELNIENIIASSQFSDGLDIQQLSEKIPNSTYNPDEFSGLSIKLEEPKIALLILSNGKVVCTGSRTKKDVERVIDNVYHRIKDLDFPVKSKYKIQIENIIVSTQLNKEMPISNIAQGLMLQHVDYEPEQFPGLIYRLDEKGIVLLLFSSGRLICTGAKNLEDATNAIEIMKEKLTSIGVL